MSKRLFVGGIPYTATDSELNQMFSQAGTVLSATIIVDKFSGRSKGFGFVEMENDADSEKAIQMFNGSDWGGRKIVVNVARPLEERAPRDFSQGRDFGGRGRRGGYR